MDHSHSMKVLVALVTVALVPTIVEASWWNTVLEWAQIDTSDPKFFCGDYECPDYTVVKKYDGYELRSYEPAVWVVANLWFTWYIGRDYHTMLDKGSHKLHRYMRGANSEGRVLMKTVPLVTVYKFENNSYSDLQLYMGRMIPKEFSENPPKPTAKHLSLQKTGRTLLYVRSFTGYGYEGIGEKGSKNYITEMLALRQNLERDRQTYLSDLSPLFAKYNSPWQVFGRHNEVAYLKEIPNTNQEITTLPR